MALDMGSRPIVIRCHLYFALSLLQTGRLRAARRLILSVLFTYVLSYVTSLQSVDTVMAPA